MDYSFRRSITLVELLVAVVLVGLLVLGISSIDVFSRFHLITSDRRMQLQNQASLCIERIAKDVVRGIGTASVPAVLTCAANELQVRYDSNENGQIDVGVDKVGRFYRNGNNLEYDSDYHPGDPYERILTQKVVNHVLTTPIDIFTWEDNVIIRIELVLRHDPANNRSIENPQLRLFSRVFCRSESIQ